MSHSHDHYDGLGPIDHADDHDHNGHEHNHSDHEDSEPALQNLLYTQIDFDKITCLNEASTDMAKTVIKKTWTQRMESEPELRSDVDEQLIITIPFTGQVRLQTILLRTSDSPLAPNTLHIFPNRPALDFETATDMVSALGPRASATATHQTLRLPRTSALQKQPVKRALFNACTSVTLFFQDNWASQHAADEDDSDVDGDDDEGDGETRLSYLGLAGEYMKLVREPVTVAYEAAANPKDHTLMQGIGGKVGSDIGAGGRGF